LGGERECESGGVVDAAAGGDRLAVETDDDVVRLEAGLADTGPGTAGVEIDRESEPAGAGGLRGGEGEADPHPGVGRGDGAFEISDRFVGGDGADRGRVGAGEVVVVVPGRRGARGIVRPVAFRPEGQGVVIIVAQKPDDFLRKCRQRAGGCNGACDSDSGEKSPEHVSGTLP